MRRAGAGLEVEEPLELGPDAGHVHGQGLAIEQVPLGGRARRVADHPGPAADQQRPAGRRAAGAGAARRSGRGGRRGATARTGRSRCSRRSADPSPAAPASPGVVAWSIPRHASSSSRPSRARRVGARVTGGAGDRHDAGHRPTGRGGFITTPMLSSGPTCIPASRGGSAIGAASDAGGLAAPSPGQGRRHRLPALPLRVVLHAWHGRVRGRRCGRLQLLQPGPARPQDTLDNLGFDQQTIVYDRTGKVELARFGETNARSSTSSTSSRPTSSTRRPRSRTRTFWSNAGFDPVGFISAAVDTAQRQRPRGGSTITQQLVRARLLPAERLPGHHVRAQDPRDHPVDPADPGLHGPGGQAADHDRLPQPELLRQPELRRRRRPPATTSASDLKELTLAQAAILAGIPQSPTAFDLRKNARGQRRPRTDAVQDRCPELRQDPASSCRWTRKIVQRRNFILDQMTDRLTSRAELGRRPRSRRLRARPSSRADHPRARSSASTGAPRTSSGRSATSWARSCAAGRRRTTAPRSTRAATRSRRRSTGRCSRRPRSGCTRPPRRAQPARTRRRTLEEPRRSRTSDWGWIANLDGRNIHNAAVGGHRLPDRPGPRLRRQRRLLRGARRQEVPAPVRRPRRRLAPARIVDQADQLRRSASTISTMTAATHVHGRRDRLRRAASCRPRRRGPRRTRSRRGCARRSSSR